MRFSRHKHLYCTVLAEYSQFVEVVRRHQKSGEEQALQNAVEECIKRGILSEYLRKKGSEAVNMLIAEYDYDMDIKEQRKEENRDILKKWLKLAAKAETIEEFERNTGRCGIKHEGENDGYNS